MKVCVINNVTLVGHDVYDKNVNIYSFFLHSDSICETSVHVMCSFICDIDLVSGSQQHQKVKVNLTLFFFFLCLFVLF